MVELRRTIMNIFEDEMACDMFIMVLKNKWLEFKEKVGNCSIEIMKDVNDPRCMSAIWTVEDPDDFMVLTKYGEEIINPFRAKLAPKTETFSDVVEAKFTFGLETDTRSSD